MQNKEFVGSSLPASIGSVPSLVSLYVTCAALKSHAWSVPFEVTGSGLTGAIPGDLSASANLKHLDLSRNAFISLSSAIASLSSLEYLDLSSNVLDGPIPPELMTLTNLARIDMTNNSLNLLRFRTNTLSSLRLLYIYSPIPCRMAWAETCRTTASTAPSLIPSPTSKPSHICIGSIPKLRTLWLGTGPECPKEYNS
ncbi:unnamed protein product, partial [Closterium sp. NIES-65]